jgi:hypothetical protein
VAPGAASYGLAASTPANYAIAAPNSSAIAPIHKDREHAYRFLLCLNE